MDNDRLNLRLETFNADLSRTSNLGPSFTGRAFPTAVRGLFAALLAGLLPTLFYRLEWLES